VISFYTINTLSEREREREKERERERERERAGRKSFSAAMLKKRPHVRPLLLRR
jgi:hypothetical protein